MNRALLLALQRHAASQLTELTTLSIDPELRGALARDGVLKRASIPYWAKEAIFYRDRGRCVLCNCDLSGLLSLQNDENYDHIVPLARGGTNDVSNLQLLCADCNKKKSCGHSVTKNTVERWF